MNHLSQSAQVDNSAFRTIKTLTPGAFTLIVPATKDGPTRLWLPKRDPIGIRVPDYTVVQSLLAVLDGPLLSVSLIMPDEEFPLVDGETVLERVGHAVEGVLDGGWVGHEPTTVVDLTSGSPELIRQGAGVLPW